MTPLLVVAAALIDADGRVLLTQAASGKLHAGSWEFPGGKLAPGESPVAGLVRELREELGIETEASCLAPFGFNSAPLDSEESGELVLLVYVCRKWRGQVRGVEGQATRWCEPSDLLTMNLAPIDRPIAAQLRDLLVG